MSFWCFWYYCFGSKNKLVNMAQFISYADVYIWFYEKSTKIQFHCAQRNQTDSLIVLSISFVILPYLISEGKFISFLQNRTEFSTQLAKKMNKSGYVVILYQPAWSDSQIASNFLFRFTRNAWTTETSIIPYWNWEEMNLKGFKISFFPV